jgi:serine/threonine protein kinase/Flp pilus assembly protein TadD
MTSSDPAESARAALRFGPYAVRGELGRGGQAVVYDAVDERLNRRVALKVLEGIGPGADAAVRRLRREVAALSQLDHPAICAVYEADFSGDTAWIAMRRVEGRTLADVLARRNAAPAPTPHTAWDRPDQTAPSLHFDADTFVDPRPPAGGSTSAGPTSATTPTFDPRRFADPAFVAAFFEKVGRALDVAHAAGLVHRDVKPGNIMVTPAGEPVLLDFGLAASTEDTPGFETLTRTNVAVGTPAYMSPEQYRGGGARLDGRTDVFSLGVALYEALTGRRPFDGPTRHALATAVLTHEPTDPRRLVPGLSRDLAATTLVALEKDLARRYATARDFADDLRRAAEGAPVRARTPGAVERAVRFARRRPALAALIAAAAIGLPTLTALWARVDALAPLAAAAKARVAAEAREATLERAFLDASEGRADHAARLFDDVLREEPSSVEARAGAALAALRLHDPAAALCALDAAPADAAPIRAFALLRADALRAAGREAEAVAAEAAAPKATLAVDAFLEGERDVARGHARTDVRLFRDALRRFEEAVATAAHARALYHYGVAHAALHADDARAARIAARTIGALWPDATEGFFWRAFAMQAADDEEAVRLFREYVARRPDAWHGRLGLGGAQERLGRLDEARRETEAALALAPRNLAALEQLARIAEKTGDRTLRLDVYRRAREAAPDRADAAQSLAVAYRDLGRPDDAIATLREALARRENDDDLVFYLVDELEAAGRPDESLRLARAAAESRPQSARARSTYARALYRREDFASARREFGAAVALGSTRADDLAFLGHSATGLRDLASAYGHLEAAVAAGDASAATARMVGLHHQTAGRSTEAVAELRRYLAQTPDDAHVRAYCAGILKNAGREDEALALFDERPQLAYAAETRGVYAVLCAWFDRAEDAERLARANFDHPQAADEARLVVAYAQTRRGRFADALDTLEELPRKPAQKGFLAYDRVFATADLGAKLKGHPADVAPLGASETEAAMLALRATGRPEFAARLFERLEGVESSDVGGPRFAVGDATRGLRHLAASCAVAAAAAASDALTAADERERARRLLTADRAELVADAKLSRQDLASHLRRRLGDPALAAVRDPAALARLGAEERLAWSVLWREYRAAAGVRD